MRCSGHRHIPGKAGLCTAAAALASLLTSMGCDTPPSVEVKGIQCQAIGDSSPAYAELGVELVLGNPTDEPLQLEVFDYTVEVGGAGSGKRWQGQWSALRTLPARESIPMRIPAVIENPFTEADGQTNWRIHGTISYKAPGRFAQILFDTGFRRPTHGFQAEGPSIAPPSGHGPS